MIILLGLGGCGRGGNASGGRPPVSQPRDATTATPSDAHAAVPPSASTASPTVGGGSLEQPAVGPAPRYPVEGDGFVLVKNWDFGTGPGSTITSTADLSANFKYHDQFSTIGNGTNYGAVMVAPDEAHALSSLHQPIEGVDTGGQPVRAFTTEGMKTFLLPLRGATECAPTRHDVGCGSFQALWTLPKGGARLGEDLLWETRVRYVTPPYFWFAIWIAGNKWVNGAEIDVVESFGYDNGGGSTNFDGRFWHSDIVAGREDISYQNWDQTMKKQGIATFDASTWHTWSLLYRADDTVAMFMDGILVQSGSTAWTLGTKPDGEELDMEFIFDGGWGHTQVQSVNRPLPASAFAGTFYEWDYSRVYLRAASPAPAR